jgi:hypothetical protein
MLYMKVADIQNYVALCRFHGWLHYRVHALASCFIKIDFNIELYLTTVTNEKMLKSKAKSKLSLCLTN